MIMDWEKISSIYSKTKPSLLNWATASFIILMKGSDVMFKLIKHHIHNNEGSLYSEKLLLICAVFIIGALIIAILSTTLSISYEEGIKQIIRNVFDH